jgi:hypothetical protein
MAPLEAAVGWAEGIFEAADLLTDFLNRSNFHGSLEGQKRPAANPWDDKFGVPYPGLTGAIQGALGLPTMADIGCNPICDATGGGSSVIDPNYSSCMSSFYGSGFGKGVEFASPLSMIPGWDPRPGKNIFENVVLFGGKMLGLKSLSGAGGASLSSLNTTSTIASPFEGLVGAGAKGALKMVGKIGPWVWGTGAFVDTMQHTGCALGQKRSAGMINLVAF